MYDFLRTGKSPLKLNKTKLQELRKNLEIGSLEYGVSGEEYIEFTTGLGIRVKIFEDGLIVLNNQNVTSETLFVDLEKVADYYENRLSKALNYLFSLGAPVPKELANIENVYPYFVVCEKATQDELAQLAARTEGERYFDFHNERYSVLRGNKYYFINNKKASEVNIERYIEEQIFIREFKGQMHRYLNIHRIVWERIDEVKEHAKVKGADIVKFSSKLEGYAKTITLIDGRIRQMGTYITTREKIAKEDKELAEFLAISGYRYETLRDTLEYLKSLWDMTKNYIVAAQKLFDGLKADVTSKSVNNLTVVTSMTAGATIIGLLTKSEPEFTTFGLVYFVILVLIGWGSTKLITYIANHRKYEISDVEYEKNIK